MKISRNVPNTCDRVLALASFSLLVRNNSKFGLKVTEVERFFFNFLIIQHRRLSVIQT